MSEEPCVSDSNPHTLHTKELVRCRSHNVPFTGGVSVLFCLLLSYFAVLLRLCLGDVHCHFLILLCHYGRFLMSEFLTLYCKDFLIPHIIDIPLTMFLWSLQSTGFQILCLVMVLFIYYSYLY